MDLNVKWLFYRTLLRTLFTYFLENDIEINTNRINVELATIIDQYLLLPINDSSMNNYTITRSNAPSVFSLINSKYTNEYSP